MRLAVAPFLLALMVTVGSASASMAQSNVTYKPAPEATLKYGDGVTVHRHADGSCEVVDSESAPEPLYGDSQPVRRTVKRKPAVKKAAAKPAAAATATVKPLTATAKAALVKKK